MVDDLHAEVDDAAAALAAEHAARLACKRGCSACCIDGITVFEVEAERIRRNHADLLATAAPHPPGACAFLGSEGECRIYASRPYVCRTQGLPLRWLDEEAETEYRDICTLNEVALEELEAESCWTIGEYESRLAELQVRTYGRMDRVALRDLF
ncbi:MAG TPA: YkgJ family cysteine cluster protein [Thermoanaerobaculia bacterium]|jgi:Fe-S-cluster containining protein